MFAVGNASSGVPGHSGQTSQKRFDADKKMGNREQIKASKPWTVPSCRDVRTSCTLLRRLQGYYIRSAKIRICQFRKFKSVLHVWVQTRCPPSRASSTCLKTNSFSLFLKLILSDYGAQLFQTALRHYPGCRTITQNRQQ